MLLKFFIPIMYLWFSGFFPTETNLTDMIGSSSLLRSHNLHFFLHWVGISVLNILLIATEVNNKVHNLQLEVSN